jgi:hypothetical protein
VSADVDELYEHCEWLNDACNAIVFKDGMRTTDCQCPGLEAGHARGVLLGLRKVLALAHRIRFDSNPQARTYEMIRAEDVRALIAKALEGKL